NIYKVNGTLNNLDSGTYPFIYNDRTYIPIRFAAEALKYTVDWDSYTNTIEINAPENTMETPVEIPAETPVETLTEIPVDSNAYVSLNGIKIAIGDSQSTVESLLGKADRVDPSVYDFSWHVYNSDYSNFIMVGIGDGEVKGLYTNVKGFETGYGNYGETGKKNTYESAIFYFDKYENNKIYAVSFVPTSPTVTITNAVLKAQELENIDAVNAFRTNYGVPTLKYDEIATITARNHSQDMADHNYFSHTDLNGLEPWDRFTNSGGTYSSVGENISAGDWSGIEAFDAWLNSSTHRDNMLSTDFTYIGVGLGYNPSSEYWYYMTQLFFAK
ncbi:MAG: CAP domain-containing protein, partial [Anaerotignaceae bacterium]